MIFVTVGAQMPFDRLMRCMDAWTGARGRHDVFAQIGNTAWRPAHMAWTTKLDPMAFRQRLSEASLVVTHAGVGTILTALEFRKRLIVMPRCADLQETRNDHQHGTARAFEEGGRLAVAWNEEDLVDHLAHVDRIPVPPRLASHASIELLDTLRAFIQHDTRPASALPAPRVIPFAPAGAGPDGLRRAA